MSFRAVLVAQSAITLAKIKPKAPAKAGAYNLKSIDKTYG
jgi:hypothetical protein